MPIRISAPSKAGPAAVAQQSSDPSGPASAISPLVPMSSSSRQPSFSSPVSPQASIPAVRSPPKYPAAQGQSQTFAACQGPTPQPSGRSAPNSETGA